VNAHNRVRICRTAGGVPDAQDHDLVPLNPIAGDAGIDAGQLAHLGSAHRATWMGEIHEALPGRRKSFGHALLRLG